MKRRLSGLKTIFLVVGLVSLCLRISVVAGPVESRQDPGPVSATGHLRTLLNRGPEMLMGANLIMLSQMRMSPGLDQEVLRRGRAMLERGKQGIQRLPGDPEPRATSLEGGGPPGMEYIRALAGAMVQVADTLEKVKLQEINPDTTSMQYFNLLINQALEMALEGSGLIMMERTGLAERSDARESVERGRTMLADARTVIIEIMGSRGMAEMHSREAGKMPAMGLTHRLTADVLKVLDLLDGLPEVQ
jgi:hypothetical protein